MPSLLTHSMDRKRFDEVWKADHVCHEVLLSFSESSSLQTKRIRLLLEDLLNLLSSPLVDCSDVSTKSKLHLQPMTTLLFLSPKPFLLATASTNEISSFLYVNQFGSISTLFRRYPLKSVRQKALGWISHFTPSSSSVPPKVFSNRIHFERLTRSGRHRPKVWIRTAVHELSSPGLLYWSREMLKRWNRLYLIFPKAFLQCLHHMWLSNNCFLHWNLCYMVREHQWKINYKSSRSCKPNFKWTND